MLPLLKRIVVSLVFVSAFAVGGAAQYKEPPVTLEGIVNQLKKRTNASAVLRVIKSNGVNFIVTAEVESQLKAAGAKPEIIQAVKENYRFPGTNKRSSYMSVTSNIPATGFTIDNNIGSFVGDIADHPVLPGTYRITAKKPGYLTETRTVVAQAGGSRNNVNFELKEAPVSVLIDEAKAALLRGDHQTVRDLCQRIRLKAPSDATVSNLLGRSYFMTSEFDQARDHLLQAIKGGQPITFKIGRRPRGVLNEFGLLKLTATNIAFINQKAERVSQVTNSEIGDTDSGFDVPYAKILVAKLNHVSDGWRIELDIEGAKKNKKEKDFDLYWPSRGTSIYDSAVCGTCSGELDVIVKLIESLRIPNK